MAYKRRGRRAQSRPAPRLSFVPTARSRRWRPRSIRALVAVTLALAIASSARSLELVELPTRLAEVSDHSNVPGFVLIIANREGIVTAFAHGLADRQSQRALSVDDYFRIGSITKTFTALTIARLAERGELALDEDLPRTVAARIENPFAATRLTIAMLLEHTAGIPDLPLEISADQIQGLSLDAVFDVHGAPIKAAWAPGKHHQYVNVGYGLAALAAETIAARPFARLLAQEVLQPLGLGSATLDKTELVTRDLATGYDRDGHTIIPYWHMAIKPFGSLNVRSREMGLLLQMFLNKGLSKGQRFLDAATIERMERGETSLLARQGIHTGYGLGLYRSDRAGVRIVTHGGDADGYLTRMAYLPDLGLGYFVGINAFQTNTINAMRTVIEETLIGSAARRANGSGDHHRPPSNLGELIGNYEKETFRFAKRRRPLNISADGNQLYLKQGSKRRPLIPVGRNRFRFPDDAAASAAYVKDDGAVFFLSTQGSYRKKD